jgi:hypothetical protein
MKRRLVITHYPREISLEIQDEARILIQTKLSYRWSIKFGVLKDYFAKRKFFTFWQGFDFPESLYCLAKPRDFIFLEALNVLPSSHKIWRKLYIENLQPSKIVEELKPYVLSRSLGRKNRND